MKFLVDAQLPARLARYLTAAGYDSVHTSELPDANRTTDDQIATIADADGRVVVTKDRDFRDSHILRRTPKRLLVVATGNISNDDLLKMFTLHIEIIAVALQESNLVELAPGRVIVHADRADDS